LQQLINQDNKVFRKDQKETEIEEKVFCVDYLILLEFLKLLGENEEKKDTRAL